MTLKSRTFECEQGHRFTVLLEDTETPPSSCEQCEAREVIQLPSNFFIRSGKVQTTKKVFRAYEQQSIDNAKATASDLGVSETATNHMKMTNFRDNARPGETVMIPQKPVAHPQMPLPQSFQQGLAYAQAEKGRPGAGSGLAALEATRSTHRQVWNSALNKGMLAKAK